MERIHDQSEEKTGQALEFAVPVDEEGRLAFDARLPSSAPKLVRVVVVLEEPEAAPEPEPAGGESPEDVRGDVEDDLREAIERLAGSAREEAIELSSQAFVIQLLRVLGNESRHPGAPIAGRHNELLFSLYRLWDHASTEDAAGAARLELSGPSKWFLSRRFSLLMDRDRDEEGDIPEAEWLKAAASSSAFGFMNDPAEDIYTAEDGEPFRDAG